MVSRSQLLGDVGLGASAIDKRIGAGRLHRVHAGVYAVGHPLLPPRGHEMAAVLACGQGTVLSHRAGAATRNLMAWSGRPEVTTTRGRGPRPGIIVHRTRALHPDDWSLVGRLPVVTWARALVDLADVLSHRRLVRALEQAVITNQYDSRQLEATMGRAHGRHALAPLSRAIAAGHHHRPQITLSDLEVAFLFLCRDVVPALPELPEMNAWVVLRDGTFRVDALFRAHRVAVELDGGAYHLTPGARRRDPRRDRLLRAAGYATPRYSDMDLHHDAHGVLADVRGHLV